MWFLYKNYPLLSTEWLALSQIMIDISLIKIIESNQNSFQEFTLISRLMYSKFTQRSFTFWCKQINTKPQLCALGCLLRRKHSKPSFSCPTFCQEPLCNFHDCCFWETLLIDRYSWTMDGWAIGWWREIEFWESKNIISKSGRGTLE